MLPALIITLREGIHSALIVGLILSYLEKTARGHLKNAVWHALALAMLGSVVGALLLQSVLFVGDEVVEGTLTLATAILVGAILLWMHRAGRRPPEVMRDVAQPATADPAAGWALGLLVFLIVMREGADIVLYLSASSASSSGIASLVGAGLGIGLSAVFALSFFEGAIRLDFERFSAATTFILAVLAGELVLRAYQEFAEVGFLPANQSTMAIIGPVVRIPVLFVLALLALPVALILAPTGPAGMPREAVLRRAWALALLAIGTVVIGLLVFDHAASKRATPASPVAVRVADGLVSVPLANLTPDKQHLFVVDVNGRPVRFFVWMLGHDPKVCLDACELCGSMGYIQDGHLLTCTNCGAAVHPPSLGQAGGCRPIPLPFTLRDGAVQISRSALEAGAELF